MWNRVISVAIFYCCICALAFSVQCERFSFDDFSNRVRAEIRTEDEKLLSIFADQLEDRYKILTARRDEKDVFFNTPRDPDATRYVLEALEKAYTQEPRDWATVAAALEIAIAGTNEDRVVHICREILENIRDVPDNAGDVVWGAAQYLLVKRDLAYVDLVVRCVYADVVGVQDEHAVGPFNSRIRDRNYLRDRAIAALAQYLPLETEAEVFRQLSQDHPMVPTNPMSWKHLIGNMLYHSARASESMLERRSRGEEIPDIAP